MARTATTNGKAPAAAAPPEPAAIAIQRIGRRRILVPIVGTTPLIVHRWSDKAKRQMLDAQQGRKAVKTVRDPEADYRDSLYLLPGGRYGFPALGFKAATIGGCRFFDKSVTMASTRQFMFFTGEMAADQSGLLVEIEGTPSMREDMVRIGTGTDLRYRGEFLEWKAVLDITYVPTALSQESVLALIEAGGMGVGVGEWRPEKSGMFGTYQLGADVAELPA